MPTKTILLIGRTGRGKSTLCNVIIGKNIFKEGEFSVSQTKQSQSETINHQGVNYVVIDTVGLGDTKLTERQVLDHLASSFSLVSSSIDQIIFVFNGKFTQEEIDAYRLLKTLFGQDVSHITTIVRTEFSKYRDINACEIDKQLIMNESNDHRDIVSRCYKFIHLNNMNEDDQPSQENRKDARTRILIHLNSCHKSILTNASTMRNNINNHYRSLEEEQRQRVILEQQRIEQEARVLAEKKRFGYDVWNQSVSIINWRNLYVTKGAPGGDTFYQSNCNVPNASTFYIQEIEGYRVVIKSQLGGYLCAYPGGQGTPIGISDTITDGCKFTILPTDYNGRYAFLTNYGTYIRYGRRFDVQTHIDDHERFTIETLSYARACIIQ